MEPKDPADWRAPDDPTPAPDPYAAPPGPGTPPPPGFPPYGDQPGMAVGEPEPPRRSRRLWWFVGGGVTLAVVLALVLWAVLPGGVTLKLDPALQSTLLAEDDYPDGYTVTQLTQSELDDADEPTQVDPDDVSPSECGQMLSTTPPDLDATLPVAMASAQGMEPTVYVNAVMRLPEEVQDEAWTLDAYDTLLDECSSFAVEADGQSLDMSVSGLDVDDLGDQAVAFLLNGSQGGMSVYFGMGIVQTDDLMILVMGVSQEEIDGDGFTELLSTAVDRAA